MCYLDYNYFYHNVQWTQYNMNALKTFVRHGRDLTNLLKKINFEGVVLWQLLSWSWAIWTIWLFIFLFRIIALNFLMNPIIFWRHTISFNNKKAYAFSNLIVTYLIQFLSCAKPILRANSYKFIITLNLVDGWVGNSSKTRN